MASYSNFNDLSNDLNISENELKGIFQLIDTLIPLEFCLQYQILPLVVQDKCLLLGVVNRDDTHDLTYIRTILNSLNYLLKTQIISADIHQIILSAYLKQHNNLLIAKQQELVPVDCTTEAIEEHLTEAPEEDNYNEYYFKPLEQFKQNPEDNSQDINNKLIVRPNTSTEVFHSSPTHILPTSENSIPSVTPKKQQDTELHLLANLNAQQLSKELLSKVLNSEIGRLYFERHPDRGRIILSQDGQIKLSLDKVSLQVFQGVINELKYLANLPLIPSKEAQTAEIKKHYKQEDVLLRLQIIGGRYGEEGSLQILKGKLLEDYQKKQILKLGEQALTLIEKLEKKLTYIDSYSRSINIETNILQTAQDLQKQLKEYLQSLADRDKSDLI
jgi:type II secretory ATPase GspE/PulE/Tfp pilus assembly ATPase PilB-like protein